MKNPIKGVITKMVTNEVLSRFLRSGELVAIGTELRNAIIIEEIENNMERNTQTLLDQFLKNVNKNNEIIRPELAIPTFILGQLLQLLPLDKNDPLWKLQHRITDCLAEFDLEGARKELLTVEIPSERTELISSILLTIKTVIERM